MAGFEPPSVSDKQPHLTTKSAGNGKRPDYMVLLYIPNIVGYIRLFLLLLAFMYLRVSPTLFVVFYSMSITLDGFDGYIARKLGQCSLFGAWFDVVLDNLSRGLLWINIHPILYLVSAVEWTAFVCNHSLGAEWRKALTARENCGVPPLSSHKKYGILSSLISCMFTNNFRNPWGVWAIAGLHVLPVWLISLQNGIFGTYLWFLPQFVPLLATAEILLLAGSFGNGQQNRQHVWRKVPSVPPP
ncbi:uncharacterized protein LOC121873333 isoform X2 [Homarus americanus]|uniref:uncharacterized protein LOC121873333 isoform X2 n=1 Tax=Homarus americanus TaxID=6706 RepID=UPI001C4651FF|nr:uncharacterized protein LOC121873333 isoform X2 [Homarus americanus]